MTTVKLKKAEREAQIIKAAENVFIEKGYNGATTSELAERANISEVTLFRYFPTKSDLFMATVEPVIIKTFDFLLEKKLPSKKLLEKFLRERIHFIIHNREMIKLILIDSKAHHELNNRIDLIDRVSEFLNEILNKVNIPKELRPTFKRFIVGSFLSFLFLPVKDDENIDEYIENVLSYISLFFLKTA